MSNETPDYGYIAYIDEAGDPGLKKVRPVDDNGSTEWLVLSAVVIRRKWEPDVKGWVSTIVSDIGIKQRNDLHYRTLSPTRKMAVASAMSALPIRGFAVCSNKKNMRGYHNPRAANMPSQEWFYNWCLRLLIERVTAFCDRRTMHDHGERKKIKLEFSRRGGHRYSQTRTYHWYLDFQRQGRSMVLTKRQPVTDLLSMDLMQDHSHYDRGGLQLSDFVASSFYQGINTIGPGQWLTDPAIALETIMAKEKDCYKDFGVTLQPSQWWKANLTKDQQKVFDHYGYNFARW